VTVSPPPSRRGRQRGTPGRRLLPDEYRVIDRYARALAQGRIARIGAASAQCREELVRLAVADGRDPRGLPASMHRQIARRGRLLGLNWAGSAWQADEKQVLDRYARECASGRYPTVAAAARACWKEMRATCSRVGRPLSGVHNRLWEAACELGRQPFRRWTAEETRVVTRHLQWLFEGRYQFVRQAAEACADEFRRRHAQGRSGTRSPPPRPATAVYERMTILAPKYRLPRRKGEMTAAERKTVEVYARALGRGQFENARVAAAACLAELRLRYGRAQRAGSVSVRRVTGHSMQTVHGELLSCLRRLRLYVLSGRRWTDEEERMCETWVRWHEHGRRARRRRLWREAVEGMVEELAHRGYRRTYQAVDARLKVARRRLRGMDR